MKIIYLLLSFALICGLASAGTIVLNPTNQDGINNALKEGDVYLNPGIYKVTGPIYIPRETALSGDHEAVILVSSDISSPWFTPTVGVINCFDPFNIVISGFTIDGNCQNLPSEWANSNPSHAHDQHRLIQVVGTSNNFGENVNIYNMTLCNSFSDGIYTRLVDGIVCKNNFITNTQHECIYYKACKNCKMLDNRMATITSDGGRFDNCFNGEFENNLVWQYNGSNNNFAYKGGANGVQIGDSGVSKGYDGRTNVLHTTNIEVHNNTIVDPGREAIVIDASGQKPSTNVFVHDNIFVDTEGIERMGIPVSDDISFDNPPTVEESTSIFDSIFNILKIEYTNTGVSKHTEANIKYKVTETEQGAIAAGVKIVGFSNVTTIDGKPYISSPADIIVKSSVVKKDPISDPYGVAYKFDKNITTKIENGTATATMKVTVKGNKKSKSTYTFNDSCSAPSILQRPSKATGKIFEYRGQGINYTKVSVNSTGLQRVIYNYNGNCTEHVLMIGEKGTDPNGISNVTFYSMNYWTGNLSHYSGSALINGTFDPKKLNVTAYTIYEEVPVNLEYKLEEWDGDSFDDTKTDLSLKIIIELITIYGLFRILKH